MNASLAFMPFSLLSLLLLLFLSVSCGREALPPTIIKGTVTDKKTGAPIRGAIAYFYFLYDGYDGTEYSDSKTLRTDSDGKFSLEQDSEYKSTDSYVSHDGYISKQSVLFYKGIENVIDLKMLPVDGVLKLEIQNLNHQYDSIYVIFENPSYVAEAGYLKEIFLDEFPLVLHQDSTYIKYLPLPSEEYTKIHWGFSYFTSLEKAVFRDSVYLTLHDTTTYKIDY